MSLENKGMSLPTDPCQLYSLQAGRRGSATLYHDPQRRVAACSHLLQESKRV